MKVSDYLTHISIAEDWVYLKKCLPDVSMHLFHTSEDYRKIVLMCCEYVLKMCMSKMHGYKQPHGMSGANLAIPFNIIAIACLDEHERIMINPFITEYLGMEITVKSNCGSIRLPGPIQVKRHETIKVEFYDTSGGRHEQIFSPDTGSLTIQHEVDHNNGILITDRT